MSVERGVEMSGTQCRRTLCTLVNKHTYVQVLAYRHPFLKTTPRSSKLGDVRWERQACPCVCVVVFLVYVDYSIRLCFSTRRNPLRLLLRPIGNAFTVVMDVSVVAGSRA